MFVDVECLLCVAVVCDTIAATEKGHGQDVGLSVLTAPDTAWDALHLANSVCTSFAGGARHAHGLTRLTDVAKEARGLEQMECGLIVQQQPGFGYLSGGTVRHNVLAVEWNDGVDFRDVCISFVPVHPVHGEGGESILIGSRAVPHVAHLVFTVVVIAGTLVGE